MGHNMLRVQAALGAGLLLSLGMFGAAPSEVRAGPLELLVTESGGPTIPIIDNGPFDTNPAPGVIDVNSAALNPLLVSYQFTSLGASSNSPGVSSLASLSQNGLVQLMPGGTGSIHVETSDIDFALPTGAHTLSGSSSATFTSAPAGNSQVFDSWFNPSNTLGATDQAGPAVSLTSTGLLPNSSAANAPGIAVGSAVPFGLTNSIDISLTGGVPGAMAQDQFAGTTALTQAVPEPASLGVILGTLALLSTRSRRRTRQ